MGPVTGGPSISVRQLLVDSPQTAKAQVDKHLDVLVKLPPGITREQAIEAIWGLLDIPLADIIFPAWDQYQAIRQARVETREHPGVTRKVDVGGHVLTSTHHPSLECDLDGKRLFVLQLELDLAFHFNGVAVTIARGEIEAIGAGDATVTATLKSATGVTLIPERQLIVMFSEPITGPSAAPRPRTVAGTEAGDLIQPAAAE